MRSGVKRRDPGQCVSLKLECNVSKGLYAETAFSRATGLSSPPDPCIRPVQWTLSRMVADYLQPHPSIKQRSFASSIKNIPTYPWKAHQADPEIIDFFVGPELTPKPAIKITTKGIWQTRDGQVRPACDFFPAIFLSPTTLPYLTLRLNSCHSLPMTAALVHFYPLPCYLATRQSLIFQSIERDFPSAVDYLLHVPGYMPSFLFCDKMTGKS